LEYFAQQLGNGEDEPVAKLAKFSWKGTEYGAHGVRTVMAVAMLLSVQRPVIRISYS
jgi:hypothetical protein